ncbi:MAG: T9SS type A sorting domain-containing protein, partial [Saprospiraceae bacterium]
DPATIRPSASSHPYTWGLAGAGTLIVHFKDILLPDSDVNEVASHGFIQFSIQQRKNVPLGTVIENTAAIYFDFNAPVITNTTLHTVGKNFYIVSVDEVPGGNLFPVEISPNPFREQTTMRLPDAAPVDALFRLYDQTGKLMRSEVFSGRTLQFSAGNMPSGFYWFEIRDTNGQIVGSGKMIRN